VEEEEEEDREREEERERRGAGWGQARPGLEAFGGCPAEPGPSG